MRSRLRTAAAAAATAETVLEQKISGHLQILVAGEVCLHSFALVETAHGNKLAKHPKHTRMHQSYGTETASESGGTVQYTCAALRKEPRNKDPFSRDG